MTSKALGVSTTAGAKLQQTLVHVVHENRARFATLVFQGLVRSLRSLAGVRGVVPLAYDAADVTAGVYPAWSATRRDPVEALRRE